MTSINVYAQGIKIQHQPSSIYVTLTGVEIGDVLSEFSEKDILDHMDFESVVAYVVERQKDDE